MKIVNRTGKILIRGSFLILSILLLYNSISAQFLIEEKKAKEGKDKIAPPQQVNELPVYIVRNVHVLKVKGVKGAIRITWDVHPDFDDDVIVGRSNEVPYTKAKALKATSIKIVPTGADRVVIDSNLSAGEYYYIVLSKEKIMDKDIELYPDVNYSTNPVIIERDIPAESYTESGEQITLIHTMIINKTQVLLTWKGVDAPGIIYTVYRSAKPLNTPDKIKRADKVAVITNGREAYADKTISKTDNYYYAVTTKTLTGKEDLRLIPDQSYTASGVFVAVGGHTTVSNLIVSLVSKGSVKLTWEGVKLTEGEYLIYRSAKKISDPQRLAVAKLISSIDLDENEFIDKEPGKGSLFYAVVVRMRDGTTDTSLVKGSNYTVNPITIGKGFKIRSIAAMLKKGKLVVKWKYRGNPGNISYQLIRLTERLRKRSDLKKGDIVDIIDVSQKSYIDSNPPVGMLYYAFVPEDYAGKGIKLKRGVNITRYPVRVKGAEDKGKEIEDTHPIEGDVSDLDHILKHNFFKGNYFYSIKKLEVIISQSDNKYEIAMAKLFIGRSWFELGRYNKALDYFLLKDVRKYFLRESNFWKEYAISRIK